MKQGQEQLKLTVNLSPQEAADRIIQMSDNMAIRSNKDAWLWWASGYSGHGTFQHQVEGDSVYVQKRPNLQNSQHGVLIRFEASPFGCSLIAAKSLNPWAKGFLRLWFSLVGLIGGLFAMSLSYKVLKGEKPIGDMIWLFAPIGMITFGWLLILFGRRLAKREILEIWKWLSNLFADAKVETK